MNKDRTPVSPELLALIERARAHKMTPEEIDAQRRSWVRGQMGLSDPTRTPEQIDAALDAVLGPPLSAQLAAAREAGKREGMEEAAATFDAYASDQRDAILKRWVHDQEAAEAEIRAEVWADAANTLWQRAAAIRAKLEEK